MVMFCIRMMKKLRERRILILSRKCCLKIRPLSICLLIQKWKNRLMLGVHYHNYG